MGEILVLLYVVVGAGLGGWIGFNGPIRPDNVARMSALLCIVLLWPFFVARVLKS